MRLQIREFNRVTKAVSKGQFGSHVVLVHRIEGVVGMDGLQSWDEAAGDGGSAQ